MHLCFCESIDRLYRISFSLLECLATQQYGLCKNIKSITTYMVGSKRKRKKSISTNNSYHVHVQLYIESCAMAQTIAIECTHCMPISNISFSHFAVSFPGLVPCFIDGRFIDIAASFSRWVSGHLCEP